ncbi:MAG: type 4a pilus biogenesis protein PilO [Gammaproteobacteria bacterium]|nr:type 4a pilus biogenesis protein PilO [Gammaproteobacteria bacterium]
MMELLDGLEKRQIGIAVGCLVVLVVALLGTYGVVPAVREYLAIADMRDAMLTMEANGNTVGVEIAEVHTQVRELEHRLTGDMANLPAKQMEAFVIGQLQDISWRHDVVLLAVEPSEGEPVEMYRELIFQVELSGRYFDLVRWLGDVSENLGFVLVKEHEMSRLDTDPDDPRLATKLLMAAYRMKEG